jgi:hypothetical protein
MTQPDDIIPFVHPPIRHPNGQMEMYRCEVRVYSGTRLDFGGHQCQNIARWRINDFDKWGDIVVCGRHKHGQHDRSTHIHTVFGNVAGEPTSWRWYRMHPAAR